MTSRVHAPDGSFADVPRGALREDAVEISQADLGQTDDGVYLEGRVLHHTSDGKSVVSCGGLLACLPTHLDRESTVRIRVFNR